jgi:hypothetical protein
VKVSNVYLRPILAGVTNIAWSLSVQGDANDSYDLSHEPDTGALPRAPNKAPICSTETTLDETSFVLEISVFPKASTKPKLC